MKKALAMILAAGMMLAMAACGAAPVSSASTPASGSAPAQGEATRTYFINPKMVGAAYWETAKEGALQAGEDLGAEVIWNGTSEVDVAKQINMVTDMITRQVDGIAVAVNDATSMTNVFNQAKEASIPVVTFDSDSENAERAYCILPDTDEAIGEAFLAALINQMPEPKGKVAVMIASPSAANIIAWRDAALAKIEAEYPEIEIVGVYPSNDDQQKAYENAKSFIQANPDLSGILCLAGAETPAACKAVQEAVEAGQLEEDQVKVGGMGIPSLVREYIKDGTMSESVMWNPASMGYLAVWTLDQLAQGNEITDGTEVPGVGTIKVDGDRIYCGTFTFTAEDVDNYQF
jgi:rhamnose transport system substrate-binding protein